MSVENKIKEGKRLEKIVREKELLEESLSEIIDLVENHPEGYNNDGFSSFNLKSYAVGDIRIPNESLKLFVIPYIKSRLYEINSILAKHN